MGERCSRDQHREQVVAMAPVLTPLATPQEGGERGTDKLKAGICLVSA